MALEYQLDNLYEMMLTALKSISNTLMTGLSVDIFVEGPELPPFVFARASSKIWRVPPLKYITNSPILGVHWALRQNFTGIFIGFSLDFFWSRGPYLRALRALHDYQKGFQCPQDLDINQNFQYVGFLLIWNTLCIKYIYIYIYIYIYE